MRVALPNFEAPPINEVAMGVRFKPIEGLLPTHFGLFWSSLKGKFGKCEDAAPLGSLEELVTSKWGGPIPRTWLIHNDGQYLIQLQPNIFYFNWRRQDDIQNYPRYSTIKPLFHEYMQRFFEFLTLEQFPPPEAVRCELTYVNVIPEGQNDGSRDAFSSLFPDLTWRQAEGRFLSVPKTLNWQTSFDLPEGAGELTAKIQSAKRVLDGHPVIRFEIGALGVDSQLPLDEIDHWFDLAHQTIVLSFVDLTSSNTQRDVWKRIHDTN